MSPKPIAAAFSPDASHLAVTDEAGGLALYSVKTGLSVTQSREAVLSLNSAQSEVRWRRLSRLDSCDSIHWSADSRRFALMGKHAVRVLDARSGETLAGVTFSDEPAATACSSDLHHLAWSSRDGEVMTATFLEDDRLSITACQDNPGGELVRLAWCGFRLALGLDDGSIEIWESDRKEWGSTLEGLEGSIESLQPLLADGRILWAADAQGGVRGFNVAKGEPIPVHGRHRSSVIRSVSGDRNTWRIASVSEHGVVLVWQLDLGSVTVVREWHAQTLAVGLVPGGDYLILLENDGTLSSKSVDRTDFLRDGVPYPWTAFAAPSDLNFPLSRGIETDAPEKSSVCETQSQTENSDCHVWIDHGGRSTVPKASEWRLLRISDTDRCRPLALSWSPDGQKLAISYAEHWVVVRDNHGRVVWRQPCNALRPVRIGWPAGAAIIFAGDSDGTLESWNADDGGWRNLFGVQGLRQPCGWSRDWQAVVWVGNDNRLAATSFREADFGSNSQDNAFGRGAGFGITAVAWAEDYRIAGLQNGNIVLFAPDLQTIVGTLCGHRSDIAGLAVSPDDGRLFSVSRDGELRLWELESNTLLHRLRIPIEGSIGPISWAPDSSTLALGVGVGLWLIGGNQTLRLYSGETVTALAFDPTGTRLVSAAMNRLFLWDTTCLFPGDPIGVNTLDSVVDRDAMCHGACIAHTTDGDELRAAGFRVEGSTWTWNDELLSSEDANASRSHNGRWIAVGSGSVAVLKDAVTGEELDSSMFLTWEEDEGVVDTVRGPFRKFAWSRDDSQVAAVDDTRLYLVNRSRWWPHPDAGWIDLRAPEHEITLLEWSPDGEVLIAGGNKGLWILREASKPIQGWIREWEYLPKSVSELRWSSDGRFLAVASTQGTVEIGVRNEPGEGTRLLGSHPARVTGLAWHPGGRLLASIAIDASIRLWDAEQFVCLGEYRLARQSDADYGSWQSRQAKGIAWSSCGSCLIVQHPVHGPVSLALGALEDPQQTPSAMGRD